MPRGSKKKYTKKQKRTARHIEEGYLRRGAPKKKAERIAWATVNKEYGGAGTDTIRNKEPAKKGGRKGGRKTAKKKKNASRRRPTRKVSSR